MTRPVTAVRTTMVKMATRKTMQRTATVKMATVEMTTVRMAPGMVPVRKSLRARATTLIENRPTDRS